MGFSRQEYWRELPCPSPGDLPDPGIEHASLASPALASRESLPLASPGKPRLWISVWNRVPDLIRRLVNLRWLKPCSPRWVSGAAEMKKAAVSSGDERSQANLKRQVSLIHHWHAGADWYQLTRANNAHFFPVWCCPVGVLQSAVISVFTPQKLANPYKSGLYYF